MNQFNVLKAAMFVQCNNQWPFQYSHHVYPCNHEGYKYQSHYITITKQTPCLVFDQSNLLLSTMLWHEAYSSSHLPSNHTAPITCHQSKAPSGPQCPLISVVSPHLSPWKYSQLSLITCPHQTARAAVGLTGTTKLLNMVVCMLNRVGSSLHVIISFTFIVWDKWSVSCITKTI